MAYNAGFPVSYPQFYPQYPQATQPQPQPIQNTGIIWVSGEAGAKSYLVAPNTTVQLWDSEAQTIYLKSADSSGMPSIKIIDYTIRQNSAPNKPEIAKVDNSIDYATKDELAALKSEINNMFEKFKEEAGA